MLMKLLRSLLCALTFVLILPMAGAATELDPAFPGYLTFRAILRGNGI